ncbi:ornithine-oxo-acid transaminase [Maudiozyma humilis]|uniref:Ornithine aminotransferase n=1 Tax=Maudiozyma humilis TaxID=51915 RepID=A0AAV5RZP3_MAUHU|nr:ornithine-oxo-acid transaminase [Kazachstania humilis]
MLSSTDAMAMEEQYSAHNYHPLPVVFHKAQGALVWDPEGREYLDFLSAYSAVNQGHCHPKIVAALTEQAQLLTLSSRAFYSDAFAEFCKFTTEFFGYETVLPMNTGAEAVETGLKLARRWGYTVKGIPEGEAIILGAQGNFHGRTFGAISLSTDEQDSRMHFGPFLTGTHAGQPLTRTGKPIRYGVASDIAEVLADHGDKVASVILEPVQGEAGIVVPPADYLPEVARLCKQHNVLLICDEVQTGIGRTGALLCSAHSGIRPDIVLLGKALSGGVLPVSCVLASRAIMDCLAPGSHGSTFGCNPLAARVAVAALKVVRDERLCERAAELGAHFLAQLRALQQEFPGVVAEVRGVGLLTAIVIDPSATGGKTAWDLCLAMKERGLLAKPTHEHIIRLAPPLVISQEQLDRGLDVIRAALRDITQ